MTLQKQLVHLNMTGGLERKADENLVMPARLLVAENVEFNDASSVKMRDGVAARAAAASPGTPFRLTSNSGRVLLEASGGNYVVDEVNDALQRITSRTATSGFSMPSNFRRAGMTTRRVAAINPKGTAAGLGTPFYTGNFDSNVLEESLCTACETRDPATGRQSIQVRVEDVNTGVVFFDNILTDGSNILVKPRVAVDDRSFYVFFGSFPSGGTTFVVKCYVFTPLGGISPIASSTGTISTAGTTESTSTDYVLFDAMWISGAMRLVVRHYNAGTWYLRCHDIDQNGALVSTSVDAAVSAAPTSLTTLLAVNGSGQTVQHVFFSVGTVNLRARGYNWSTGTWIAESTVGTAPAGTTTGRVAAYAPSSSLIYVAFDALNTASGGLISTLRASRFTHAYGSVSECAAFSPWKVAGRLALVGGRLYLPMIWASDQYQSTSFVIDFTSVLSNLGVAGNTGAPPHVIARIDYGEGATTGTGMNGCFTQNRVPSAAVVGDELFLPYLKYETNLRLVGTTNDTSVCVALARVDFSDMLADAEVDGLTFMSAACPLLFDGASVVEEGFHHGPEIIGTVTGAASGTYQLPNVVATYTICFTMAWQDARGNWYESAPSNEVSVTIAVGSQYITPIVAVPPTLKPGAFLVFYRTKGSSTDTTLYVGATTAGVSITSDATLDDGESLYTTGGVLPNTPAPACRHAMVSQRRVFLSGCGDGTRVYWSKAKDTGYAIEFCADDPSHGQQVPASVGRVVGSAEVDGNVMFLCENAHGVIGGTGPSPTGTTGFYSEFNTIPTDAGALWESPKSIVRTRDGIWFHSSSGLRMLDRSGNIAVNADGRQSGSEVDALVTSAPIASLLVGQQVRFFRQGDAVTPVFDTLWKQWTSFTLPPPIDAAWGSSGAYFLCRSTLGATALRYFSSSVLSDTHEDGGTTNYRATIRTAWLAFAGIQGFQRLYRLMLLFQIPRAIDVTLNTYVNRSTSVAETASLAGSTTEEWQHHFATQKCESMQIEVSWNPTVRTSGGVFRLSDMTLQVGGKFGLFKTPSSQRF